MSTAVLACTNAGITDNACLMNSSVTELLNVPAVMMSGSVMSPVQQIAPVLVLALLVLKLVMIIYLICCLVQSDKLI